MFLCVFHVMDFSYQYCWNSFKHTVCSVRISAHQVFTEGENGEWQTTGRDSVHPRLLQQTEFYCNSGGLNFMDWPVIPFGLSLWCKRMSKLIRFWYQWFQVCMMNLSVSWCDWPFLGSYKNEESNMDMSIRLPSNNFQTATPITLNMLWGPLVVRIIRVYLRAETQIFRHLAAVLWFHLSSGDIILHWPDWTKTANTPASEITACCERVPSDCFVLCDCSLPQGRFMASYIIECWDQTFLWNSPSS